MDQSTASVWGQQEVTSRQLEMKNAIFKAESARKQLPGAAAVGAPQSNKKQQRKFMENKPG